MTNETLKSCLAVISTAVLVVTASAASAVAQETTPPPVSTAPPAVGGSVGYFGEHGQIAISGEFKFNILRQSQSMGGGSNTTYEIQPSVDYFVSSNVSVGGLLGIRRDVPDAIGTPTIITFGARVGYNLFLTNSVSLWIRGGLSYEHVSNDSPGNAPDISGYAIPVRLYAPFLWHPVTHLFIGAGPFLATDLVAKAEGDDVPKRTDIGVASTIGGYFGGL